jgi:hypothetical protein
MPRVPFTPDFPLRPISEADGEALGQVFRTAAEHSALDERASSSRARTSRGAEPGGRTASLRSTPRLERRLHEARGRPLRLGRYDVVRCIGAGGMGVVFEAVHVDQGHRVALKTRKAKTRAGLACLKNEFRSLSSVVHPNLVSLLELGAEGGEWFLAMELVDGEIFTEHVRADGAGASGWEHLDQTLEHVPIQGDAPGSIDFSAPFVAFHEGRLRAALRQLVSAVARLHDLGKLHRDLNPGNVLVTREGRVVVVDFGLIRDRATRAGVEVGASGTPAYMAPEQAAGKPASPASDWYAVGVLLFEALTGQLPFSGNTARVLTNKLRYAAPPPSALAEGVPRDLDALCSSLLRRDPSERPDAAAVMRALGAAALPLFTTLAQARFIGRRAELRALHEAWRAGRDRPVAAVVHGPSGSGKTALLSRFVESLGAEGRAPLVLRGRCSARETIPHRLLDGVVDALAAHLDSLHDAELAALLPPCFGDLAREFPVLAAPHVEATPGGPLGATAAIACLQELLAQLGAARSVVIAIDDAHLGSGEEGRRLAELAGPGVFVVMTHASEDLGSSPVLAEVSRFFAGGDGELCHVVLAPLLPEEALALAASATKDAAAARAIAAMSAGSPAVVETLLGVTARRGLPASRAEAVAARLAELSEPERWLAEVVAAARFTLDRGLLFAAAKVGPAGERALVSLEAKRFVRVSGVAETDRVRLYDEGLRAAISAATSPERARQAALELARVLARRAGADPLEVAGCYARGGAWQEAADHLDAAATAAIGEGDPHLAARLWERALEVTPAGTDGARALSLWRAEALAAAGCSVAAAQAYLDHLAGASRAERLERRLRAAELLLVAGHVDAGLATLLPVLDAHGISWPATTQGAMLSIAARLGPILVGGVRLPDSPAAWPREAVDAEARARVEALWLAARGLSLYDPLRAGVFVLEALASARAARDGEHATIALALVGSMLVYRGGAADEARGTDLIEEAARYARRSGDIYLLGFVWFCSGLARMFAGRFREALARVDEGLELLTAKKARLAWERNAHRAVALQVLFEQGALAERARRAHTWLEQAKSWNDRAGEAHSALGVAFAELAGGDPSGARATVAQALALTWRGGFGLPHQIALWLEVSSFLYEGDVASARAHLLGSWPRLERSQIMRIQLVRIEAVALRGLTAVAASGASLRLAALDAASLEREKRPHALAAAAVLHAGVAAARGKIASAAEHLDAAALAYGSAEMKVHAATARRARGTLLGGVEGRALVAEGDEVLLAEGVKEPGRWTAMYTGIGVARRSS